MNAIIDSQIDPAVARAAAHMTLALQECDPALRDEAVTLLKHLVDESLDDDDRFATMALLHEILFPNGDPHGTIGLDLEDAEGYAREITPEAVQILDRMDSEEQLFADNLRRVMKERGVSQEELAAKLGIGQPAISMMLQRSCRPQKKTILRISAALEVSPQDLWPGFSST